MLLYVIVYLIIGAIVEVVTGVYVAYYEDKIGFGYLTHEEGLAILGRHFMKCKPYYWKVISYFPNTIGMIFGTIIALIFWPFHAPWLIKHWTQAYDEYKEESLRNSEA